MIRGRLRVIRAQDSVLWLCGFVLAFFLFNQTVSTAEAAGCMTWKVPPLVRWARFYDVDSLGQLGLDSGRRISVFSEYGCYDLSGRTWSGRLSFYFNNAADDESNLRPKILGVAVVKTKWGGGERDRPKAPAILAFYRNGNELDEVGRWYTGVAGPTYTLIRRQDLKAVPSPFDPAEDIRLESLGDVTDVIRMGGDPDGLVDAWRSAVVVPTEADDEFLIADNGLLLDERWSMSDVPTQDRDDMHVYQRNYLIKYVESTAPSRKRFFYIDRRDSKCIYIALMRTPADDSVLTTSAEVGDMLVLRLDPAASC